MGDRQDKDIIASKVEYDAPVPARKRNAGSPFSRARARPFSNDGIQQSNSRAAPAAKTTRTQTSTQNRQSAVTDSGWKPFFQLAIPKSGRIHPSVIVGTRAVSEQLDSQALEVISTFSWFEYGRAALRGALLDRGVVPLAGRRLPMTAIQPQGRRLRRPDCAACYPPVLSLLCANPFPAKPIRIPR